MRDLLKRLVLFVCMLFSVLGQRVSAATYTSVLLNPIGALASGGEGIANGSQVGRILSSAQGSPIHAGLWSGTAGSFVDLHPSTFEFSSAYGVGGGQQVGEGNLFPLGGRALLWSGTAASVVDLTPPGVSYAVAQGVNGGQQVGYVGTPVVRAALWTGTAASYVDLNPTGFAYSRAYATDGTRQVGEGEGRALLWSGAANSYVELNPLGYSGSEARGISGGQQVGLGTLTGGTNERALLWTGTAASVVDLTPVGFTRAVAYGTNGLQQVGAGAGTATGGINFNHALLWSGTAGSYIDLHALLPSDRTWVYSFASGIDSAGNIVGTAYDSNSTYAVLWSIPEPSAIALAGVCIGGLLARRRR